MAKPLTLVFQGTAIDFQLDRVERSDLYGSIDTEVVDEDGKLCQLATLIGDGHTVAGSGGIALGYLSPEGFWRKKTELRPVDVHGATVELVRSSFDAPNPLVEQVSVEEYLDHDIRAIYHLETEGDFSGLKKELAAGTIYKFPFNYRASLEASAGFVLLGADGNLFLCVGSKAAIEYVGLRSAAMVVEEETPAEEEDLLDFGNM